MNEALQKLEIKVENGGSTPQGRVSAAEWNVLVAGVKALDLAGFNEESLREYLDQYDYITRPELNKALEGIGGGGGIAYPLSWSGYSSGMYDGSAPANIAIPSLVSQLTNDVKFITSADLPSFSLRASSSSIGKLYLCKNGVDESEATLRLPTKLSQFANDSDFITSDSVNSLLTDYLPKSGGIVNGSIYFGATGPKGENTSGLFRIGKFDENGGLKLQFGAYSGASFQIVDRGWSEALLFLDASGDFRVKGSVTATNFIGDLQGHADSATLWSYNSPFAQDFNALNYCNNGLYHFNGDYANLAGRPPHYSWNYSVLNMGTGSGRRQQLAIPYDTSKMFLRVNVDDNWSGWREFAFVDTDSLTPASGILRVNGNFLATGEVSWNSSRVLKNIIGDTPTYMSLDDLMLIKPYRYTWKDARDLKVHAGGIADEVMEILPEVVITDAKGIHSMDYGQAAFTIAASLTPYVNDHERRIKELERENRELKKRLNVE